MNKKPLPVNVETTQMKTRWIPLICLGLMLIGLYPALTHAQGTASYRAMGMGSVHTAIANDVDAFGWNPARLAFDPEYHFTMSLYQFGMYGRNNSFTIADYNEYFDKEKVISDAEKADIIGKIEDGMLKINATGQGNLLSGTFRNLGYGLSGGYNIGMVAAGSGKLTAEFFEMLLYDNLAGTHFDFTDDEIYGEGFAAGSFDIALARQVPIPALAQYGIHLSTGLTFKYLYGGGFSRVEEAHGMVQIVDELSNGTKTKLVANGQARVTSALGGSGFGMDWGLAATYNQWSAGLSIENLIGKITWDKEVEQSYVDFAVDFYGANEIDDFDTTYVDTTYTLSQTKMDLPTVFRIGAAYQLRPNLLLAADLESSLQETGGYTKATRVALGAEYYPTSWLPLRTGLSVGGIGGAAWSMGTGLEFGHFSYGISTFNILEIGENIKSVSFSTGMKLRF